MPTSAKIGYGTTFAIGNGATPTEVFTTVAEVTDVGPPSLSRETVDGTHMTSPDQFREFIGGLRDSGEASITLNFVPGGAAFDALKAAYDAADPKNYKIVFAGGSESVTFPAICTGISSVVPMADKMTLTATFKGAGKPTWS